MVIHRGLSVVTLLMIGGIAVSQQTLEGKVQVLLESIGHGQAWQQNTWVTEPTTFGATWVKSKPMRFAFGVEGNLHSFSWDERVNDIRKRRSGAGAFFSGPEEVLARAMGLKDALVSDPENWVPSRVSDLKDPSVADQMEYRGGAITAILKHVANNLPVYGEQVAVTFDNEDGAVVSIVVSCRRQVFEPVGNILTPAQAEERARAIATEYLRRTLGDESANQIIGTFLSPSETPVSLAYGPLAPGFDSKFREYTVRRLMPPVYLVDFGSAEVYVHARTGECLGGDLDAESAGLLPPLGEEQAGVGPSARASKRLAVNGEPSPVIVLGAVALLAVVGSFCLRTLIRR